MGVLFITFPVDAQERYQRWGGGVDDENIHFGFSFHYIHADYKIVLKPDWQMPSSQTSPDGTPPFTSIRSPFTRGVGLGLLADLKLTENANLRFTPTLAFSNKVVEYNLAISPTEEGEKKPHNPVRPTSYIDLPLLFKFKSDRKGNMRGYLIGGGKYAINVTSRKRYDDSGNVPTEKYLKTKPGYFSYEAGIGFDIYFDFFKMSPEVRWVQSIGNVLDDREPNMYNDPIERLTLRNFQISLFFE